MITGVLVGVSVRKARPLHPTQVLAQADVAALVSVVLDVVLVDLSVPVVRSPDDRTEQCRL